MVLPPPPPRGSPPGPLPLTCRRPGRGLALLPGSLSLTWGRPGRGLALLPAPLPLRRMHVVCRGIPKTHHNISSPDLATIPVLCLV